MIKKTLILTSLILSGCTVFAASYMQLAMYPSASAVSGASAFCMEGSEGLNDNPASASAAASVSAMHFVTGLGISVQDISYNSPFSAGYYGISLSNYSFGQEQRIDADSFGNPVMTGQNMELGVFCLSGTYARKFGKLSAGASMGFASEDLGSKSFKYLAGIGFRLDDLLTKGFSAGLAVTGLDITGNGFKSAGASLQYSVKNDLPFSVASGFEYDGYNISAGLGVSARVVSELSLSAGARYRGANFTFSAGAGFALGAAKIKYSYEPFLITGDVHRVSLTYAFEESGGSVQQSDSGDKSFSAYMRNGDYYYSGRQYSQAAKYYEYINVLYWKDLQKMSETERSRFFQKLGICYYNIKDNARAKQYFEQAVFLTPDNEILKHWLRALK